MTCSELRARLDDPDCAADGVLAPELRAHMDGCAECARYWERLAAILDPSSVLRREIPPPSDLWPAIESQLDAAEDRKIWSVPSFLPLAAAAGIAAVLVTSLFSSPAPQRATEATVPVRITGTAARKATALLPAETVEIGFVQTRAVLMRRVEARKQTAAPAPIAALEHTLSTMDSAIRDIHAALERDPYNASLLFKLSHTRRRELRLLQQVVL